MSNIVTFVPRFGTRRRERDNKLIKVPAISACGSQQLSVRLDGIEVALVLDRPQAPLSFIVSDLTEDETTAVKQAVAARHQAEPSSVQSPPADDSDEPEVDDESITYEPDASDDF